MKNAILNLLFPPKCIICGKLVESDKIAVCDKCLEKLEFNNKKCSVCGKPLDTVYGDALCKMCRDGKRPFVRAFVPLLYKGSARRAIQRFKFSHRVAFCKTFAALIFIEIKESGYIPDIVTFVPIHFIRRGERGYNQSELVARELAALLGVRCVPMLKKLKNTEPLYKMKPKEREKTVKGLFACTKENISAERILLVDDIITTGSTLTECSKMLKKATKAEISVAAIASAG